MVQPLFRAVVRQFPWCWEAKEQMEKLKKDAWSVILQVPNIPENMERNDQQTLREPSTGDD